MVRASLFLYTLAFTGGNGLVRIAPSTESNPDCDVGDIESLLPYQRQLIADFSDGSSALGRTCWNTKQGRVDGAAQALFILGVKALSNFMYDYCKAVFDELIEKKPEFVMGYWGRAMCEGQLIWNVENPVKSYAYLKKGMKLAHYSSLDSISRSVYDASVALTDWNATHADCPSTTVSRDSKAAIEETRPCRFL